MWSDRAEANGTGPTPQSYVNLPAWHFVFLVMFVNLNLCLLKSSHCLKSSIIIPIFVLKCSINKI